MTTHFRYIMSAVIGLCGAICVCVCLFTGMIDHAIEQTTGHPEYTISYYIGK